MSTKQCLPHLGLTVGRAVAIGHRWDGKKKRFIVCRDVKTIIKLTLSQATFFSRLALESRNNVSDKIPLPKKTSRWSKF